MAYIWSFILYSYKVYCILWNRHTRYCPVSYPVKSGCCHVCQCVFSDIWLLSKTAMLSKHGMLPRQQALLWTVKWFIALDSQPAHVFANNPHHAWRFEVLVLLLVIVSVILHISNLTFYAFSSWCSAIACRVELEVVFMDDVSRYLAIVRTWGKCFAGELITDMPTCSLFLLALYFGMCIMPKQEQALLCFLLSI